MPDANNRVVKQDMQALLLGAELRIVQFKPPAAGPDPPPDPPNPNFSVSFPDIQRQIAEKSAQERVDALFDFLVHLIVQGSGEEISRQQIVQRITNLEERVRTVEGILSRNNLT